jgi:hypothetical protein
VVEDGVIEYDGSRGMTWASMAHVPTGRSLLVYGMHPLCCLGADVQVGLRERERQILRMLVCACVRVCADQESSLLVYGMHPLCCLGADVQVDVLVCARMSGEGGGGREVASRP